MVAYGKNWKRAIIVYMDMVLLISTVLREGMKKHPTTKTTRRDHFGSLFSIYYMKDLGGLLEYQ